MHHVRFRDPAGSIRTGEWTEDGIIFADRTYDYDDVDILPPSEPTKIVCVGKNYVAHAEEMGDEDVPDRPLLFLKGPNALAGHEDTVTLPTGKERVDHEAELAVIIGEQCRNVPEENAMDVVAGFTCGIDISNRDDQQKEQNWVRGKAFDNSAPLGPTRTTVDEVPDDATIQLQVNGETRQNASIEAMFYSVPSLIAEITELITLEPGDIIMTGTPEGVAPLQDGDTVTVEIDGIPPLTVHIEE